MHTLNPFVCGTFHDEYDEPCLASPLSSPRKNKRKDSKNNPYSTSGLDKFSQLLADLDEKRQKIYSQMNPHDISFVRFVYSNANDIVPVVVKVKNNKDQKQKSQEVARIKTLTHTSESMDKSETTDQNPAEERKQHKIETNTKVAKKSFSWDMEKPSFYLPVVMVLILLLLVAFGRSVTSLCTCILWYMISTLKDNSASNTKMSVKKKDYVRGLTEKKIAINEGVKKKDYVRRWSEKKMVVNEGTKKKDYVRGWSEKKMATDGLLSPSGGDSEASKKRFKHSIHISKAGDEE